MISSPISPGAHLSELDMAETEPLGSRPDKNVITFIRSAR
jgi:hypothetical protein